MKINVQRFFTQRALSLMALFAFIIVSARADDRVFTVTEGAYPWFDRIGQWTLTNVPDTLKGSVPLPQGDCSSRSLEVTGKPTSITIGVQTNDVAKFVEKFPAAKDSGTQIAVKNTDGTTLPYSVFTFASPPAKIDGAGVFGAGLLLLKMEDGEPAAATGVSPSGSPKPSAVPQPSVSPTAAQGFRDWRRYAAAMQEAQTIESA